MLARSYTVTLSERVLPKHYKISLSKNWCKPTFSKFKFFVQRNEIIKENTSNASSRNSDHLQEFHKRFKISTG